MDKRDLCDTLQHQLSITIDTQDGVWPLVFTHTSQDNKHNYERLEFLGDRVLGLSVAALLCRLFPNSNEGGLAQRQARLVSTETLAEISRELATIEQKIRLRGNPVNDSIRADVVEALIGYLYLQHGFAVAERFVLLHWEQRAKALQKPPKDPRSALQELAMQRGFATPDYCFIEQTGDAHCPSFVFEVHALDATATGKSTNKQGAKTQAALALLQKLAHQP